MHEGLERAASLGGWGQALQVVYVVLMASLVLQLETKAASMLVRVTPLMGAFFLQLLSSYFFYAQDAYLVISFGSHALNSFRYAITSPSWGSNPSEELRVQLFVVHPQLLLCVWAAFGYALLDLGPFHIY